MYTRYIYMYTGIYICIHTCIHMHSTATPMQQRGVHVRHGRYRIHIHVCKRICLHVQISTPYTVIHLHAYVHTYVCMLMNSDILRYTCISV